MTSFMCIAAGPIDFRHAFLDMTNIEVKESPYTRAGRTCPAAMGFSFAAGTTDGESATHFCNSSLSLWLTNNTVCLLSFCEPVTVTDHHKISACEAFGSLSFC